MKIGDRELPSSLTKTQIEEDVILLKYFATDDWMVNMNTQGRSNSSKRNSNNSSSQWNRSSSSSNSYLNSNKKAWMVCINTNRPEDRSDYCKQTYRVSKIAVAKCRVIKNNNFY